MAAPKQNFWQRLLDYRLELGVTQTEMARRMQTTQAYVSKLERKPAERVALGWAMRYARALEMNLIITLGN